MEKTTDMLSKLVEDTLSSRVEQSLENMNKISDALINMADYVNTSRAMINQTVSTSFELNDQSTACLYKLFYRLLRTLCRCLIPFSCGRLHRYRLTAAHSN